VTNNSVLGASSNKTSFVLQTEKVEVGPVLDMVPYVLSDGYTINLKINASLKEFLGYEKIANATYSRPLFRSQNTETTVNVWDGQTVMLGGMTTTVTNNVTDKVPVLGSVPLVGRLFQSESKHVVKKNLMVFVTATIVDPAGNRVHSDDQIPFNPNTIPPQPR
jgi:general secretion pathway protein D